MILENSPNITYVNNKFLEHYLPSQSRVETTIHNGDIYEFDIGLSEPENFIDLIKSSFDLYKEKGHLYDVTVSGLKTDEGQKKGSERFCTNSEPFAGFINNIITNSNAFPMYSEKSGEVYFGVSPYFRFMRYHQGGMHFPHYDSDYDFKWGKGLSTRYSLVMYFSDNDSGEIAFINDRTKWAKEKSDWSRQAKDTEIFLKIKPKKMKMVIFPHDVCHSVLELKEESERIMVRGDVIFSRG